MMFTGNEFLVIGKKKSWQENCIISGPQKDIGYMKSGL